MKKPGKNSVLFEVLKSLVPYTEQNLNLVFRPESFFNRLEKFTKSNRQTLASTLSRAKRNGLVEMLDGRPTLTALGRSKISQLAKPDLLTG